ncbi:MAG: ECF transporter S component [Promethearchaeota archaeon]
MKSNTPVYYFRTRDLVTIGVLSALGGALSTYVGYLGRLVNVAVGVPFGAGQFLSGLHVFWIVLAAGLVRKTGAATLTGLLKGLVEFFTGNPHGIVIVLVSLAQGLIIDAGLTATGYRDSLPIYCIISGLAAASNVVLFQLLYFSGVPLVFFLLLVVLAFSSGIIFAGYFGKATLDLVIEANVMQVRTPTPPTVTKTRTQKRYLNPYKISAVVFLSIIFIGAGLYTIFVWRPIVDPLSCDVTGLVNNPYRFTYSAFSSEEIIVEAELVGSVTYVPPQNYTGIPLAIILSHAQPAEGASTLLVLASDGYSATFSLVDVLSDSGIIIIVDNGLRIVAKSYSGEFWVRKVSSLVIS